MNLLGLKILMLGASHLATPGYFGTVLHNQLADQGAVVHTVAVCGAFPSHWILPDEGNCGSLEKTGNNPAEFRLGKSPKTKSYLELVALDSPNLVILVMGDSVANYVAPSMDKKWAYQEINKLTNVIEQSKIPCLFIGPPWGTEGGNSKKTNNRVREVSEILKNGVKPCKYIDSLKLSRPGEWDTTDGLHLTQKGYKEWATRVMQEIQKTP
jgi:hypothetical protein